MNDRGRPQLCVHFTVKNLRNIVLFPAFLPVSMSYGTKWKKINKTSNIMIFY